MIFGFRSMVFSFEDRELETRNFETICISDLLKTI
jgi:hypothetical protein